MSLYQGVEETDLFESGMTSSECGQVGEGVSAIVQLINTRVGKRIGLAYATFAPRSSS